jgi:hypothetical protein
MANNFNICDQPPLEVRDADGSTISHARQQLFATVGPASYATGGIPVDLSATFASLTAVRVTRAYVTATKQQTGYLVEVVETGTDVFASAKFRLVVSRQAAPPLTTDADVVKVTGTVANVAATETGAAGMCGAVACNGNHPASVVAQRSNLVQGSGAAKVAVATAASPTTFVEVPGATDLSTVTVEYLALGSAA